LLQIYNTISRKKEPFSPRNPRKVSLYVCGITVYDHCHLGHARSAIIFDVIRNYLEYRNFKVYYVKNYTDVDDKIIARAQREGRGWREIADQFIQSYDRDMSRLGVRRPSLAPKATDHISEMIRLIEGLVSKGVAYVVDGDVFYDVKVFEAYGKLSRQKTDELISGARVEIDQRKKTPLDFALWKHSKPGEPAWESPWGMGRPGWHVECSAMAIKHLGKSIDLHGGGEDLIFPHHENELAQSEAYTGEDFVSCWIHHAFVTVDQEKMSKSLGNFFTVDDIFQKLSQFPESIISEVLRFYLISTHYRSPVDFSGQSLRTAKSGLDNFYTLFQKADEVSDSVGEGAPQATDRYRQEGGMEALRSDFEAAMDDDFNTAKAIGILQQLRSEANRNLKKRAFKSALTATKLIKSLGKLLGIFSLSPREWRFQTWDMLGEETLSKSQEIMNHSILSPDVMNHRSEASIQALILERESARRKKEWKKSDSIRDKLASAGVIIEDRPDGTTRVKR